MRHLLLVTFVALSGCAPGSPQPDAPAATVTVVGTVEKVCLECAEALLTTGGGLVWDALTVRVSSPEAYAGSSISVEVLVSGTAQRVRYPQGRIIRFRAAEAGIEQHRVVLDAEDIHDG